MINSVTRVILVSGVPKRVLAEMGTAKAMDEIPRCVANPESIKLPSAPESINAETWKVAPPTRTEARYSEWPVDGSRVEVMHTMCSPLRDYRPAMGHVAAICPPHRSTGTADWPGDGVAPPPSDVLLRPAWAPPPERRGIETVSHKQSLTWRP